LLLNKSWNPQKTSFDDIVVYIKENSILEPILVSVSDDIQVI